MDLVTKLMKHLRRSHHGDVVCVRNDVHGTRDGDARGDGVHDDVRDGNVHGAHDDRDAELLLVLLVALVLQRRQYAVHASGDDHDARGDGAQTGVDDGDDGHDDSDDDHDGDDRDVDVPQSVALSYHS